MLTNGADLIRTSGQTEERFAALREVEPVAAVSASSDSHAQLDANTQDALLRFARFLHKEGSPKKKPAAPPQVVAKKVARDPYREQQMHQEVLFGRGEMISIYV